MATVGEAQVRIVADARGFARDVERQVNRAIRDVDVDADPIANGIAQGLAAGGTQRVIADGGRRAGRRWIEQFGIVLQGGISPRAAGAIGGAVLAALGPVLLTVGTLLGGLLITGFGSGIAGLGLFFAAQQGQVQNEFIGVFREIGNQFAVISRPLIAPLLDLARIVLDAFAPFRIAFQQAFIDLAPALSVFFRDMARAFEAFAPAIGPITDAFIEILEELGPELANDVFPDLAEAIINLANAIGDNADVFVDILTWFLSIPEALINFLAELTRITGWFADNPAFIIAALVGIGVVIGALIAGPVGALVGGIIGLGIALLNLRDQFVSAWNLISETVGNAIDAIGDFFVEFGRDAARLWSNFQSNTSNALLSVGRFFLRMRDRVLGVRDSIRRGFLNLVDFFRGLPGSISRAVSGAFDGLWQAFRGAINNIIGAWNNLRFPSVTVGGGDPLGPFGPSLPQTTIGGWDLPNIPFLQRGGIIQRAGAAVVGDRGPELLSLPAGAMVQPLPAPSAPGAPDEFEATAIIDMGSGIQQAVNLTFRRVAGNARAGQRRTAAMA